MKFCIKCGSVMVPVKKDGRLILKCTRCGYEMEPSEKDLEKYKVRAVADEKAKVISTKVISQTRRAKVSKEELEQAKEEYYELVLDQIGEYGE